MAVTTATTGMTDSTVVAIRTANHSELEKTLRAGSHDFYREGGGIAGDANEAANNTTKLRTMVTNLTDGTWSSTGGTIYIPPGTWWFEPQLYDPTKTTVQEPKNLQEKRVVTLPDDRPLRFFGASGTAQSTLKIRNGLSTDTTEVDSDNYRAFFLGDYNDSNTTHADVSGLMVHDLVFDFNKAYNKIPDAFNQLLGGNRRAAIEFRIGRNVHIFNNTFTNVLARNTVIAWHATERAVGGVPIDPKVLLEAVSDIHIHHNAFLNVGSAVPATEEDDWDYSGIYLDAVRAYIHDNTFQGETPGATGARTSMELHVSHAQIYNNTVTDFQNGMMVVGGTYTGEGSTVVNYPQRGITISKNTITRCMRGIRLYPWYLGTEYDVESGTAANQPLFMNVLVAQNVINLDRYAWQGYHEYQLFYAGACISRASINKFTRTQGIRIEGHKIAKDTIFAPIQGLRIIRNTITFAKPPARIAAHVFRRVYSAAAAGATTVNIANKGAISRTSGDPVWIRVRSGSAYLWHRTTLASTPTATSMTISAAIPVGYTADANAPILFLTFPSQASLHFDGKVSTTGLTTSSQEIKVKDTAGNPVQLTRRAGEPIYVTLNTGGTHYTSVSYVVDANGNHLYEGTSDTFGLTTQLPSSANVDNIVSMPYAFDVWTTLSSAASTVNNITTITVPAVFGRVGARTRKGRTFSGDPIVVMLDDGTMHQTTISSINYSAGVYNVVLANKTLSAAASGSAVRFPYIHTDAGEKDACGIFMSPGNTLTRVTANSPRNTGSSASSLTLKSVYGLTPATRSGGVVTALGTQLSITYKIYPAPDLIANPCASTQGAATAYVDTISGNVVTLITDTGAAFLLPGDVEGDADGGYAVTRTEQYPLLENVSIERNSIFDAQGQGISLGMELRNVTIRQNYIRDPNQSGMIAKASRTGIMLSFGGQEVTNLLIANNKIADSGIFDTTYYGLYSQLAPSTTRNISFVNNVWLPLYKREGKDVEIANSYHSNVLVQSSTAAVEAYSPPPRSLSYGSTVYDEASGTEYAWTTAMTGTSYTSYVPGAAATTTQPGIVTQAAAQTDSTAATVAALTTDLNALLAKLRTAGLI